MCLCFRMTVICFYRGFYEELNNIVKTKLSVSTRKIPNDEEVIFFIVG